jgi:hypothetical protein
MNPTQPMSAAICELEKAEHGMALPYDAERVEQLRSMLREARKLKLSRAPGGKTGGITGSHGRPLILWIGGRLAGRVRPFTGAGDLEKEAW